MDVYFILWGGVGGYGHCSEYLLKLIYSLMSTSFPTDPVCPVGGISPIRTVQVFNHAPLKEYTSFCGTCTICKFYLIVDALCRILVSTFTQIAEFM